MRVLILIKKEFIQNLRDWRVNSLMVLLPILLIVILGAAFSGVFNSTIKLNSTTVLYMADSGQYLEDGFREFSEELGRELGVTFEETGDLEKGRESVRNSGYACFIYLSGNPDEIRIYKNDKHNFEANLIHSALKTFVDRYGAMAAIYRYDPAGAGRILSDASMDFTSVESLDRKRQPGSLDYYAVTMLTLILMYASLVGFWAIRSEQDLKTGNRILCSPTRKYEYLTGKVLGGIVITVVQALVVIFFSKLVLKAWWGEDIATVLLIVLTLSIMAISIGTGIAYLIKNEGAASGILNIIIPILVLFGGGYTPLENMGPGVMKLSAVSPLKWTNDAIFRVIYDNDYTLVATAVFINLAIAAAFILISAALSRKEAV